MVTNINKEGGLNYYETHFETQNSLAPIAVEIPRFWAWIATDSGNSFK